MGTATGQDCPASYAQQAMWHAYQLASRSGGALYHVAIRATADGPLDVAELRRALEALTDRHPALRSTFAPAGDGLIQRLHESRPVDLAVLDTAGWTKREVDAAVQAEIGRPFDLTRDPALRVRVLTGGAPAPVLVLVFHHIAWDFESILLALDELGALYRTPEPDLPEPPASYAEYARWEQEHVRSAAGDRSYAYWRDRISALPPPADLPTDRPRAAGRDHAGAVYPVRLDPSLAEGAGRLAGELKITRNAILLATFQLLLARLTGQPRSAIGVAGTQRLSRRFARTVGNFVNPFVLGTDVSSATTFGGLARRVNTEVLRALPHAGFPFPLLVERLRPDHDRSRSPMFDVLYVYNRPSSRRLDELARFVAGRGDADLGGLKLRSEPVDLTTAMYDLTLYVIDSTDGLSVQWEYRTDLFGVEQVHRLNDRFQTLLRAALDLPTAPIDRVAATLPETERRQVLLDWNDTEVRYGGPWLLHELVAEQVARTPDARAVSAADGVLTYRELDRHATRLAERLRGLGVTADVPVAVCLPRSPRLVVALLGVLKAGGAYVPLDPDNPRERLAHFAADSRASVLVTTREDRVETPGHAPVVLTLDDEYAITTERGPAPATLPKPVRGAGADPDSLAYVIYTSGSTGRPKGVMNTHRGVVNRLRWMQERHRLTPADRVLQKTSAGFDVSVWEFFWPLTNGARLVLAAPRGHRDPAYLAGVLREECITVVHFVPSMLRVFLSDPAVRPLPSLRLLVCSGEALTRAHVDRAGAVLGVPVDNMYGPTEAAIDVTAAMIETTGDRAEAVPIGRPMANVRVYVLDALMRPLPVGVVGELYLGGVQLARGYLRDPGLTAAAFRPDPFGEGRLYRTGDFVRWSPRGTLEYVGRTDQQVKVRGYRVELEEAREAVESDPEVRAALVVAHPGDAGLRLLAYVVPGDTATFSPHELRRRLRERHPEYLVPGGVVTLDRLPVGPHGKADRSALPPPGEDAWASRQEYVPPSGPLEEEMARIWADVLGVERVGRHDDFFDIGGHSLLAARITGRVADRLGVRLGVGDVFTAPTLERFSTAVLTSALDEPDDDVLSAAPTEADGGR